MVNRRAIAIACRAVILGLAFGYFSFVLPGVLIGLAMAEDVPWTFGPAVMTAALVLVPPTALFYAWRQADKLDTPS